MRFDKPRHFRQSMTWVHTWSGLVLGWLLFAVFVTGTLSFFRNEITLWMQPELHRARASDQAAERAFETLARVAPDAQQWTVSLPNPRSAVVGLSWREAQPAGGPQGAARGAEGGAGRGEGARAERDAGERGAGERGMSGVRGAGERAEGAAGRGESPRAGRDAGERSAGERGVGARGAGERGARGDEPGVDEPGTGAAEPPAAQAQAQPGGGGGGGRPQQGVKRATMDPATGELIEPRQTAGGNFLYRFHFELYGMDRVWGRWIVGAATMFMFVALITGVIVHRTIFRDFFTFRPAKGKRSWLDAHNASGVLSLPFHLVITFSGLVLLGAQLMPFAASSAYDGDAAAYGRELRGARVEGPATRPSGQPAALAGIGALLDEGARRWPDEGVGTITVTHPNDARATIELRQARGTGLANRGAAERLLFDGVSGALLEAPPVAAPTAVRAIHNVLSAVHLGRFASPLPRWLLFASGVLGSLMLASGLVLWVVSRLKDRPADGRVPFGHRLVEVLNVAAVAGLLVAIAAHFWANRLIPADLAERNLWEIRAFFGVWMLTLLHALLRRHKQAWIEQLVAGGVLLAALPLVNGLTGGAHLGASMAAGQWQVAGFDLCVLALGLLLLYAARGVVRHVPRERAGKPDVAAGLHTGGEAEPAVVAPAVLKTEEA